jgi:DNA-binding GntR family transcriptional regulator
MTQIRIPNRLLRRVVLLSGDPDTGAAVAAMEPEELRAVALAAMMLVRMLLRMIAEMGNQTVDQVYALCLEILDRRRGH